MSNQAFLVSIEQLIQEGTDIKEKIVTLNNQNTNDSTYEIVALARKIVNEWEKSVGESLENKSSRDLLAFKNVRATNAARSNFNVELSGLFFYVSDRVNFLIELLDKYDRLQREEDNPKSVMVNSSGNSFVNIGNQNSFGNISIMENFHEIEVKLKGLGIEENQITQLKTIITTNSENKKDKITKWLGSVTASIAARGLYDNIPVLIEYVQGLIPS